MGMLRALWAYRGFILGNVKREFQSKYRNSLLGAAWNVINPSVDDHRLHGDLRAGHARETAWR